MTHDLQALRRDTRGFTGAEKALVACFALAIVVAAGVLLSGGSKQAAGDAERALRSRGGGPAALQGTTALADTQILHATGGIAPAGPVAAPGDPSTDQILRDYQVRDDKMTEWEPWGPAGWFTDPVKMTETEAGLLSDLQWSNGLLGLNDFKNIKEEAYSESEDRFHGAGAEDGHQDAFRHIYWNVLMSRQFGDDFAAAFATAHEGVPGNPADREAMDLHNNELGRRIAREHPNASKEELQEIIMEEIKNGHAVVINDKGELVYSDQAEVGHTGTADDAPVQGTKAPPEWSES